MSVEEVKGWAIGCVVVALFDVGPICFASYHAAEGSRGAAAVLAVLVVLCALCAAGFAWAARSLARRGRGS